MNDPAENRQSNTAGGGWGEKQGGPMGGDPSPPDKMQPSLTGVAVVPQWQLYVLRKMLKRMRLREARSSAAIPLSVLPAKPMAYRGADGKMRMPPVRLSAGARVAVEWWDRWGEALDHAARSGMRRV